MFSKREEAIGQLIIDGYRTSTRESESSDLQPLRNLCQYLWRSLSSEQKETLDSDTVEPLIEIKIETPRLRK